MRGEKGCAPGREKHDKWIDKKKKNVQIAEGQSAFFVRIFVCKGIRF